MSISLYNYTPCNSTWTCLKDGKYMAVGAIEPQFYAELLSKIGSDFDEFPQLIGPDSDDLKIKLANIFKTKTRDEWSEIFDGSDACVTPVLELNEAPEHPHNKARESFVKNHAGDMMAPVRTSILLHSGMNPA